MSRGKIFFKKEAKKYCNLFRSDVFYSIIFNQGVCLMDIKQDFTFDPPCVTNFEDLLQVKPPEQPAGFRKFWQDTYNLVMDAPLKYRIETELWSPVPEEKIFRVRAVNWDGVEFSMWITRPADSKGGILSGQGYGHPLTPDDDYYTYLLKQASDDEAEENLTTHRLTRCLPMIRGLGLSQCKDIPWQTAYHAMHGIGSKETYILRGAVADEWMAVRILLDMFPDCADNLNYSGGSMGGGMGALLLACDNRFKAAFLHVPAFGEFHYFMTREDIRKKYFAEHPEVYGVLRYFNAAHAAKYIRIPVCCTPALSDPTVAPYGQFAIVNAIPEQYKTVFIRETGHSKETAKDKEAERQLRIWIKKNF